MPVLATSILRSPSVKRAATEFHEFPMPNSEKLANQVLRRTFNAPAKGRAQSSPMSNAFPYKKEATV